MLITNFKAIQGFYTKFQTIFLGSRSPNTFQAFQGFQGAMWTLTNTNFVQNPSVFTGKDNINLNEYWLETDLKKIKNNIDPGYICKHCETKIFFAIELDAFSKLS